MTRADTSTALHPRCHSGVCCLLVLLIWGCGGQGPQRRPAARQVLDMEPILLEFDSQAKAGERIKAYDAESLFNTGKDAFETEQFEVCEDAYTNLIKRFPKSRYAHSAHYNLGLCLESLKRYGDAAQHFLIHARRAKTLDDRRDGEFRLGFNLVKMGDFPGAIDLYDALLAAKDLTILDLAECRLRRAMAFAGLHRPGDADADLAKVLAYVEKATGGLSEGNAILAEANFRRGEIYQSLAHGVALALPMDSMQKDLAEKVRFFRQSQRGYLAALNVRNHYWGTAAGLKLGELYEQFYDDVLGAEVPDDFDDKTTEFYLLELRKQLQPLLEHSLSIYEKNMSMSARLGEENEWVAETEKRMAKLRNLIAETQELDPTSVLDEEAPPASGGASNIQRKKTSKVTRPVEDKK